MNNIFTKKTLVIISIVSLALSVGAVAYADSALRQISAYQNQALKVTVNGSAIDMSSEDGTMYPIVYEGHSYVSAKAVAEKLGASVKWNANTQTVEITSGSNGSGGSGVPDKDNTTKPAQTPTSSGSTSTNAGTKSDPVKFGSTFTYTENWNYKKGVNDTYTAKYAVTVKSVTPLSWDDLGDLGYKADGDPRIDYVLADVSLKVTDATFSKGSGDSSMGYKYLSLYRPEIWGTKTADGKNYIIGGHDFGFDGSWDKKADDATDRSKVYDGETKSYEMTGKILLSVVKGTENLLVLKQKNPDMDSEKAQIYFKLQ